MKESGQGSRIRTATPADAEALAALAEQTFRDTFAADNAANDMDSYVSEFFAAERILTELLDTGSPYLLAFVEEDAGPAGYARLRDGAVDPSVMGPSPIELERLYVDRRYLGRGLGAALMTASLAIAQAAGRETLWLGVWERNARAIAFYERWGFRPVGDHVFQLGSDPQRDLIMQRPVIAPSD